nr:phosphate acyltransferase [Ferrovum sp.]
MNEMTPLSPRFAAILERARNHPPLPVAVVDAHEAHVPAGVVEASDYGLKAEILQNAIDLARILGVDRPKAAALSAIELVKQSIPSTLDAACLSKMAQRGQITHAEVDGPLAFDNAISSDAARIKEINSTVAGDADILLAPNLDAGNILAKNLEYLAGATLAGIVIGVSVPLMLTSRSDPTAARLMSAAIAVLLHQHWGADGVSLVAAPMTGDEP